MKKTFLKLLRKTRESRKPLIDGKNNNSDTGDGCEHGCYGYDNPHAQNILNNNKEQNQERTNHFLSNTSSQNLESLTFPNPPADLDQNLQQHLNDVETAFFERLRPLPPPDHHRHFFDHLDVLLQNISSSKSYFILIRWVQDFYMSQEKLGRPDHSLFSEWKTKATKKLIPNVKNEVKTSLDKILQAERGLLLCYTEETYIGLYVDTIQCVSAIPREAQKINSDLYDQIQEACFQELLQFVKKYATQQADVLGKLSEMEDPQTFHFLKTLKTCKELKQHVQGQDIKSSLLKEIVSNLEDIEHFTLKYLTEIISDIAERHLKNYFKGDNRGLSCFTSDLEKHYPKLGYVKDEQKMVMDEAYQIIAHTYLQHLLRSKQQKLRKFWSHDVGLRVSDDADKLHNTISNLAPDVQQFKLLKSVSEVLECEPMDALKLVTANMMMTCCKKSSCDEDQELLRKLLRWKGLSLWKVREVMDALPGCSSTPGSSWFCCCCLSCC